MTVTALLISLALQAQTLDKPSVQYYQHEFQIRSHGKVELVPLEVAAVTNPPFVAFRKNDAFAVWDERGLTVRKGPKASSSRLPDIAVSPHAFAREEILKTIRKIRSGEYSKNAAALSGAKRIGKDVYFLLRWEDRNNTPWAEALVQVDLEDPNPQPKLLGRFEGLSTATKSIDDKLQILHGRLTIVERSEKSWGLSTYDPETQRFRTQAMGGTLVSFSPLNTTQGLFVEISSYGTQIAGRVDLENGTRRIFYEGRERVHFADLQSPPIILAVNNGKTKMVNGSTGAIRIVPFEAQAKRAEKSVLIYSPTDEPTVVWQLDPESWATLASWKAKGSG